MDKRTKITPQKQAEVKPVVGYDINTPPDPNDLLQTFLKENNLVLTVSAISDNNSYISKQGFILTDKPLLLVSVKYK